MLVAVVLAAGPLAGCGGGDDGPRLTVYSGRTENLVGPLLEQFSADTGIGIDVRYGQSADLALRLEQEGDRTPADVFISQSPGPIGLLAGDGLLAPLPAEVLDLVPTDRQASNGRWVGVSARQRVLVYDRDLVDASDLPSSVMELTDPAWRGRVAVAPSNGSFQDFVTAMRLELGDDATAAWLDGLAANDPRTYASNTAIVEAVSRGEVEVGLVNHYYNARFLAEDPSLPTRNHHFSDGDLGSLVLLTGAGITSSSEQPDVAADLVRYLLSASAQRFFVDETFEYPVVEGVAPPAGLDPLPSADAGGVDLEGLEGGLARTLELIDESGLNAG